MSEKISKVSSSSITVKNKGWRVVFAGLGINLALGVLYTWSVVSKGIPDVWGWSEADKSLPYSVACLVFSLVMVPAGSMQDRIGPRTVASIGGLLVGIGLLTASQTTTTLGFIFGFGILAGAGIGFGYASATPPAVKWFPAARTGLIAGIVVSGFGLASVYVAPLVKTLIQAYSLSTTLMILGVGFLVIVVGLAQFLQPPPMGYIPAGTPPMPANKSAAKMEYHPKEMLKTWQFYALWFMYACGAGAGLMIISKLAKIAEVQSGVSLGFVLVAILAVGNGGGRIVAGILSDKFGRKKTLFSCFVLQAVTILLLSQAGSGNVLGSSLVLGILSALVGANYGANLALFPSITKDYYGIRNFGVNYGLVFTSWGLGGFTLSLLAGQVYDRTQSFTFAYYCSAALLVAAALMALCLKPVQQKV
ncbi:MAG: MFS transporter [Candidatus Electrothrix sp. AX5]|nr:MFS transporter [Candidatus Electrothrix sp. AX5]